MKEHYNYDEIYGTLIHHNKEDTERTYFIIECQYWKFYKWMFMHGWKLINKTKSANKSFDGYDVILHSRFI